MNAAIFHINKQIKCGEILFDLLSFETFVLYKEFVPSSIS